MDEVGWEVAAHRCQTYLENLLNNWGTCARFSMDSSWINATLTLLICIG